MRSTGSPVLQNATSADIFSTLGMLDPITRLNKRKPHSAFPVVHETKCYGYAAGCEIPSEEQELLMTLDSIHSGFAADVRYPLEEQELLIP
jgi:hypothetical protein